MAIKERTEILYMFKRFGQYWTGDEGTANSTYALAVKEAKAQSDQVIGQFYPHRRPARPPPRTPRPQPDQPPPEENMDQDPPTV